MSRPASVVLGLGQAEEEAVEELLYASGRLELRGSGADADELVALTATHAPDLVLVSSGLPGFDALQLGRLRALGSRVAGLALDRRAEAVLRAAQLELVVRTPVELEPLLAFAAAPVGTSRAEEAPPNAAAPERAGSVVAVVGGRGAPGASELAASFAALVARDFPVLLAEFDADGGRLGVRLGLDDSGDALLGLTRALQAGETGVATLLPHWIAGEHDGWSAVLAAPSADVGGLAELADAGVAARVLDVLTASFPLVVCDVGQRLRCGGASDLAARLHREVVTAADALILVLGARPEQRREGLAQADLVLDELGLRPELVRVAVNGQPGLRAPRTDADGDGALTAALAARGLTIDAWLPFDERALRAALRRGAPLATAAPRGAYAGALAQLAAALLLPSLPRPAARKRRLTPQAEPSERARDVREVVLPWRRS